MKSDTRNIQSICPGCFHTLNRQGFCTQCHTRMRSTGATALPLRTVLFGRYLLGKPLGKGGFGITYLGWDLTASVKVAIKEFFPREFAARKKNTDEVTVLRPNCTAMFDRGLSAFIEEARVLLSISRLSGAIQMRDFFGANGTAYIVMDYLEGESLHQYVVRRGGILGATEALRLFRPVLDSLAVLHRYGVLHRDVSPENILICEGVGRLIDFGAASRYDQNAFKPFAVLKAGFSPIELYDAQLKQGSWTDVYGAAATLYACLTGKIPPAVTRRCTRDVLIRPRRMGLAVPFCVEAAMMKGLSLYPDERFGSINEMIRALYDPGQTLNAFEI